MLKDKSNMESEGEGEEKFGSEGGERVEVP
jgi:hypothetical protein